MAVSLTLLYALLIVGLTAMAIYAQVTASSLSLPLPAGVTVLAIFLPLLSAVNIVYLPVLGRVLNNNKGESRQQQQQQHPRALRLLLPAALQAAQAVLTVVLATLAASEGMLPGAQLDCRLATAWQRLWSAHDGRAIQRAQDALGCCGLNTVRHMAWPDARQCAALYGRTLPCRGPWRQATQRAAGLDFCVVVAVGLVQILQLVILRLRTVEEPYNRRAGGYRDEDDVADGEEPGRERLIEQQQEDDPASVGQRQEDAGESDGRGPHNGSGGGGYGQAEERGWGRIEPSGLA